MNRAVPLVVVAVSFSWLGITACNSATLAGQTVRPGGTLDIRYPLDKYFQDYAASGNNTRPTTGHALISFPKNFDPARTWPILIIVSTADYHWTNAMSAPPYQQAGISEGWIVLAADATIVPHDDSEAWRVALIGAALQLLYKNWPQSTHWPVAFGGLSGGAKRTGFVAAMLESSNKIKICGFFLAGINDDRISVAYQMYRPPPEFLNIPIWLSSGISDPIAPPFKHEHVRASLVNTGFKHVRLESFAGSHEVQPAQVQLALRWFRQLGNF
ncbi:MAG TPA: hypothetical protein VKS98_00490 [Chthoniobacterales bacterium]|nr:hypothetical protein [Chthoniobacterales bacterium]